MTTRFQSVQHTEFGQLRTRSRVSKEVFCSIALLVEIFADVQPICSQSAGVEGSPGIPHLMKFSGVLNEPISSAAEDSSATTLSAAGKATVVTPASSLTVTTPGGTANTIPKFSSASEIINSQIIDNGVVHLMNLENVLFADQFTGADC